MFNEKKNRRQPGCPRAWPQYLRGDAHDRLPWRPGQKDPADDHRLDPWVERLEGQRGKTFHVAHGFPVYFPPDEEIDSVIVSLCSRFHAFHGAVRHNAAPAVNLLLGYIGQCQKDAVAPDEIQNTVRYLRVCAVCYRMSFGKVFGQECKVGAAIRVRFRRNSPYHALPNRGAARKRAAIPHGSALPRSFHNFVVCGA